MQRPGQKSLPKPLQFDLPGIVPQHTLGQLQSPRPDPGGPNINQSSFQGEILTWVNIRNVGDLATVIMTSRQHVQQVPNALNVEQFQALHGFAVHPSQGAHRFIWITRAGIGRRSAV